ncbi:hypothetical protein BCR44DRAFT_347838 [Catenaria anguillulae PL171]|uniref:Uncharacterized protein n=1 Tax=Catenaria anguillulae PL171 TaxID=765915 RepID=A0A1Y2I2R3_9FUNG|nr:hypothetical protein BCR44DRAFT_347838 [Catenaria anguillulae PL171]
MPSFLSTGLPFLLLHPEAFDDVQITQMEAQQEKSHMPTSPSRVYIYLVIVTPRLFIYAHSNVRACDPPPAHFPHTRHWLTPLSP